MNKRQKEIQQLFLNDEKAVLKQLERNYKEALEEIDQKLEVLMARQDADMSHVIYQIEHQRALRTQVKSILENLQSKEFDSISEYLANSYTNGFVGTMYDIHGQGVPLIVPIDQKKVLEAIKHETKLSENLYTSLGLDIADLQKKIASEISRGISSGLGYAEIARNIASYSNIPKNRAMTIARTESHRIQCKATLDAQYEAKSKGADVVKQWDSTLDGLTRDSHRKLDGQIRELDEYFSSSGGRKAKYPGGFGRPEEDCNCRCALLQRAKWNLGKEELNTLKERAEFFGLDKSEEFADFKKKYLKATDRVQVSTQMMKNTEKQAESTMKTLKNEEKSGTIEIDELTPCLRRMSDGKIIDTTVLDVTPTKAEFEDWEFDWTLPQKNGYIVRAIKANGDDRIQGMVALKPDAQNYAVNIDIVEAAPFNNPHNKAYVKKEYSGIGGHLFAEAVKESMAQGYDGYVYFKAKTDLIKHYQNELGAVLINPKERIMAIDERSAKVLYDRYYKGK